MVFGEPELWVEPDEEVRVITDAGGSRLEETGNSRARFYVGLTSLILASVLLLWSGLTVVAAMPEEAPEIVNGCHPHQNEVVLGGNPPFCMDETEVETVNSIEVSEDQHIREKVTDRNGWEHEVEYRWEDMDGAVVYGFMEGRYECFRFIPEWALAEDWVVEDFEEPFSFPDWCGSEYEDPNSRVYEPGAHPHDDVWIYEIESSGNGEFSLYAHKITEQELLFRTYMSKSLVEQERNAMGGDGDVSDLGTLCCTLPLGLLFLLAADQRRQVFFIDRKANTITKKRAGSWPSFSTVWPQIDFSAVKLTRNVREEYHSPENGDSWTSYHDGVDVVVTTKGLAKTMFFFEDEGKDHVHRKVLTDLMTMMGVEGELSIETAADTIQDIDLNAPKEEVTGDVADINQAPLIHKKGGPWGYGSAHEETPVSDQPLKEQQSGDAPAGSFWTFDDVEKP